MRTLAHLAIDDFLERIDALGRVLRVGNVHEMHAVCGLLEAVSFLFFLEVSRATRRGLVCGWGGEGRYTRCDLVELEEFATLRICMRGRDCDMVDGLVVGVFWR